VENSVYKKALDTAHAEIAELVRQRAEVDKRISQLTVTVDALTALMDSVPVAYDDTPSTMEEVGISDAIKQVLRCSPVPLTPGEIKAKLTESGFDASVYANDGAVIQSTLKRLEKQGDVSLVGSVYLAVSL
jgi:hypothetical protein